MSFGFIFMAFTGAVPVLLKDWRISAGQAGLIHTGWHLGYLVSLFAAGFFSDRFGAKRTFLAMSGAAVVSALAFATMAQGFVSALALYTVTGLCSGGSYTPGLTLISQRFSAARRGAAMGWYLAASTMGYALSLVLGAALLASFGWRASFIAAAMGPCVGIAIASWVLRDSRNIVALREAAESKVQSLMAVLRNKPAMLAIWGYAFHAWELLGLWAWLPAYLAAAARRTHEPEAAASVGSLLAALSFATNAVGSVMAVMTVASLACSFAFGWLFGLPLWLLTIVAIVYNLVALGDSSVYSAALTELVPADSLGAAYSLRAAIGFGLGGASPVIFGLVFDHFTGDPQQGPELGWGLAWAALGVGAIPGLIAVRRLRAMRGA
jgi:MFS family permease